MPALQTFLQQTFSEKFGAANIQLQAVCGGSINQAYQVRFSDQRFFCKVNSATKFPHLFALEKQGLELLRRQNQIRTPAVIDCFETNGYQLLLLEWVDEGSRTENFWITFGRQLAALHRVTADSYGLEENNYMGSVPQSNKLHQRWCSFFAEERLAPMAEQCAEQGLLTKQHQAQLNTLSKKLPEIFEDENPALLHGDLWSGNFLCTAAGEPVLIDPAVYYGHRSMDLAMTTLFGGFHRTFYEAYQHHFPLPANYREQWAVCNLYPLLIHLYLFGTGYLAGIERTLKQFT